MNLNNKKTEAFVFCVIIAIFLSLNLITAERSPTVWQDEVMFADPAINLATKGEWNSTAWGTQSSDDFFAGNAPLYSFVLAGWLEVWGVNITAVRSLNYIITGISVFLIWFWARRTEVIPTGLGRLASVILILTGQGITFSYRSGRYDALGYLLLSAGLAAFIIKKREQRYGMLFVIGLLLPWTGLQLLLYAGVLALIYFVSFGTRHFKEWFFAGAGATFGLIGMVIVFKRIDVWVPFAASVFSLSTAGNSFGAKASNLAGAYFIDWSVVVVSLAICSTIVGFTSRNRDSRMTIFSMIVLLVIPAFFHLFAKYTDAYTWMVYVPVCIAAGSLLSKIQYVGGRVKLLTYGAILCMASLVGLPARIFVSVVDWNSRAYQNISNPVENVIVANDVVFADFQSYYAVKGKVAQVFFPTYISMMTEEEKNSVTIILLNNSDLGKIVSALGGDWSPISTTEELVRSDPRKVFGRALALPYSVRAYRRRMLP